MTATTKIRLTTITNIEQLIGYETPVEALHGQCVYVVDRHPEGAHEQRISLTRRMPRTNRGIERAEGWLGNTDNNYAESWGAFEVVGNSRTHLHLRKTAETPALFPANAAVAAEIRLQEQVTREIEAYHAERDALLNEQEEVA